jgi:hypothetical protein
MGKDEFCNIKSLVLHVAFLYRTLSHNYLIMVDCMLGSYFQELKCSALLRDIGGLPQGEGDSISRVSHLDLIIEMR